MVDNYLEGYHVPIAHPGLMRLYDYKNYDVELHDNWLWYDAPLRDKPSGNRVERLYQRMVEPMPGLTEDDRRVWRYIFIYPNTTIDLYPDQVGIWAINPDGPLKSSDLNLTLLPEGDSRRSRLVQQANRRINKLTSDEDADLVANQQAGLETRGFEPGPAVAARTGAGLVCRQDPRRPRRSRLTEVAATEHGARERILAAAVERIASDGIDDMRIARVAMDAGVSTSLVHYHFETREALLGEALEYSYERAGLARLAADEEAEADPERRLLAMVDNCLPYPGELRQDWVLWLELWLRTVRYPELAPTAARLYGRMRDWLSEGIEACVGPAGARRRGAGRPHPRAVRRAAACAC